MLDQSFAVADLPKIATLSFLEILLSADNAVVLGVLCNTLPQNLRKKALFLGVGSAFIFRAVAIFFLFYLLENPWVQVLGAAYLLYLCIRFFMYRTKTSHPNTIHSLWKVVLLIEVIDLAFAVDSIVAGLAFIDSLESKIWIVYVGGMVGLFGMRFAADFFSSLLDKFPNLEKSAYLMVGLIGIKLGLQAFNTPFPLYFFWITIVLLFLLGFIGKKR